MNKLLIALCLATSTSLTLAAPAPADKAPQAVHEGRHDHHKHQHGEQGRRHDRQPPVSYTETQVRTLEDGRQFKRETRQVVKENSVSRKTTLTRPDGKTASREMQRSLDPAKGSWRHSVKGHDFDGESYAHESHGRKGEGPAAKAQ